MLQSKRLRRSCPHGIVNLHECEYCCMEEGGMRAEVERSDPPSALLFDVSRRDERKRKASFSYPSNCPNEFHLPQIVDRYNQVRPNYLLLGRISGYHYTPPEQYGWIFTGSCQLKKVEFYQMETELGMVYLDFYFTEGTVQSMLFHKTEGNMLLFAKGRSLLPDIYVEILRDPLATTDTKYRRRCLFS